MSRGRSHRLFLLLGVIGLAGGQKPDRRQGGDQGQNSGFHKIRLS